MKTYIKGIVLSAVLLCFSCSGGDSGGKSGGGGGGITPHTPVLPTEVTLNTNSLSLMVGETSQLTATVKPSNADNKTVSWSSNNADVATVKSGLVTAVSPGNATIMVATVAGDKTATCSVTVTKNNISVTGITLSPTSINIKAGDNTSIQAEISPKNATNKKINWSSSNQSVVTVTPGKTEGAATINAISEGTATITATSDDNSDIKATCLVNVTKKHIDVTAVELDKTTTDIYIGDNLALKATISPDDATDKKVNWTSSDNSVATITKGQTEGTAMVNALKEGTVTITASSNDNSSIKATCLVNVTKKTIPVSSISLSRSSIEIKVGKSGQITATIQPLNATYKDIDWSIDDTSIVSINSSSNTSVTFTTLKEGTTTLTAKSRQYPDITSSCIITSSAIPVTDIELNFHSLKLEVGNSTTIMATVSPSDATYKDLVWECNKNGFVNLTPSGNVATITALKSGTVTVTVSSKKTPSVKDVCTIVIPVEEGGTEGTEEEPWK